jgi:plastocyanin
MKLLNFLLALTASMAGVPNCLAGSKEYVVDPWAPPDPWGEGYPTINVYAGDTLTFNWPYGEDYNVWQHPSLSCDDETNASLVGSSSGATYSFTEWDGTPEGKPTLFVCNLHDYCDQGMSIRVNVFSGAEPDPTSAPWAAPTWAPTVWVEPPTLAPTFPDTLSPTYYVAEENPVAPPTYPPTYYPTESFDDATQSPTKQAVPGNEVVVKEILIENWDIPADGQPFPPIEANVGDTIKFVVNPGHDVYIHPSLTCDDKTNAILVGDNEIPAEYTIQEAEAGTEMMFVCAVGAHCGLGMQLKVIVAPVQLQEEPPEAENDLEPKNIPIDWFIPTDGQPYDPVQAKVGDTITFSMGAGHNVHVHPSGSCDQTGRAFVGEDAPATYKFLPEDEGKTLFFACDVGTHCDLGMQIEVTVSGGIEEDTGLTPPIFEDEIDVEPKNIPIDWFIPTDGQPYDPVQAKVGDTITFSMGAGHNVHVHPSGSCDQTGRVFVGEDAPTTYTFLAEDEGTTMFFACDVGTHCDLGMQIQVTVSAGQPAGNNDIGNPFVEEADLIQSKEIIVDYWARPESGEAFDPIEASVGDTIIFSWEGNQNVFIHPSKNCDPTFSIFVGISSPAAYTFQSSDGSPEGKEHLFVSDIGSNCELGMQLPVKVFSSAEVTSDGSGQPSTVPSGSGSVMSSVIYSNRAVLSSAVVMLGWMLQLQHCHCGIVVHESP